MIYLQKVFDDLAHGEFSNIKIGQSQLGTLTEADYPRIISAINLGLIELYKRFKLKEKDCSIYPYSGILIYYLRNEHIGAIGGLTDSLYLVSGNATDPFNDDLIKVLEVYDSLGDEVPLNDSGYPDKGVFTPTQDTIKISSDNTLERIDLVYLAYHPEIVLTNSFNPKTYKLYFPDFILDALLNFTASRVFKGKTSKAAEGETQLSVTFLQQYENACRKITDYGLINEATTPKKRFTQNGWA